MRVPPSLRMPFISKTISEISQGFVSCAVTVESPARRDAQSSLGQICTGKMGLIYTFYKSPSPREVPRDLSVSAQSHSAF